MKRFLERLGNLSILWVVGLVGILSGVVLTIGFLWARFPMQANRLKDRYDLKHAGVKSVTIHGLHAFERNFCQDGKPCICVGLVHGIADDARTWKQILMRPASSWLRPVRLVAFDMPGSGDSPVPRSNSDYSARVQAETLRAAMGVLCPRWIVVGNSMGGWIATWEAFDWPQGIEALVLADSSGLMADATTTRVFYANPSIDSLKDYQRKAYYIPRELPPPVWSSALDSIREGNARAEANAQGPSDFLDSHLGGLKVPTLVLWGEADGITPPAEGKKMAAAIPRAVWDPVSHCAHLPQKECPDRVVDAIDYFLGPAELPPKK